MKSIDCIDPVRFSEQFGAEASSESEVHPNDRFRERLVKHALLRSQVQAAIAELIRGYERTTSLSVVRVEYQPETCQVILEAVPVS